MATLIELVQQLRDKTGAGILDCKKALTETENDLDKAVDWLREKGIAKAAAKASRIAAEGKAVIVIDGNKALLAEINTETDFSAKTERFLEMADKVGKVILDAEPADVDAALNVSTPEGPVSELISAVSFATGEKITLRRFAIVKKSDDQIFGSYLHHDGKTACVVVLNGDRADVAKSVAMQVASMNPSYVDRAHMPADIIEHERAVQIEIAKNDPANASKPANIVEKMVEGRVSKSLQEMCLVDQAFILDGSLKVSQYLKNNGCSVECFVRYLVGEGIEKRVDDWVAEVNAALAK
ncbi:MAG: elongation factor Ts [Erysipelotrichaceae bacterium]|nr:elongation factor Ts [Erysipelotrichaceae bacterium]